MTFHGGVRDSDRKNSAACMLFFPLNLTDLPTEDPNGASDSSVNIASHTSHLSAKYIETVKA